MVKQQKYGKPFLYSLSLHITVLLLMIVSFEFSSTMPVVESSNKNIEIINAIALNQPPTQLKFNPQPPQPKPKPIHAQQKKLVPVQPKKNTIAIAHKKQKKLRQEKIKQKAVEAAFAKELKELNAKSLQQQMLREKKRIADVRSQQVSGEVNKYKALILQAISQRWLIPPGVNKKLFSELLIRVAPGGVVLDVQIIKSSGDQALDRSARAAVFKASPLPVPKEADAFESFRQFVLKVKPENVLSNESWAN